MNETTLDALINLFALFTSISESKKEDAVRIFSMYLQLHLGISSSEEYVDLFEELLDLYGTDGEQLIPIDLNQQAKTVSSNIKNRLQREEQVMVFLRFLELVKTGNITKAENLLKTLSDVFEIDEDELRKFREFIFLSSPESLTASGFLLIDSYEECANKNLKHIYEKNFSGELLFLKSTLIGHYIFILKGAEELTLEGNPIIPDRFYAFKEGGIIRGTRISPIYYIDIASKYIDKKLSAPFIFSGEELEFRFRNSENGLYRFSFSENSSQLVAIMGGSGVGKSTLLNILNGNIPVQHGTIRINQFDIHKDKKEIDGLIGFVPQDDLLFEDLTVKENLYYNARLCFDELLKEDIEKKVDQTLHELELYNFKDLKVGSPLKKTISGGQRKRLNVAMELIREPAILFVDEPTSGLSSTDSEKIMLLLKQQARKGKLIMVNIHQPSSMIFKLFDKLWIMDKGGRPIYTGNPLDAIIYFKKEVNHINSEICECLNCGNVNPEQVLEIVETKMIDSSGNFTNKRRFSPEYWYSLYSERNKLKKDNEERVYGSLPPIESKRPGLIKQFSIFFERNFRIKFSDRQYVLINLLEAILLAAVVGYFTRFAEGDKYIFFENKSLISYLFMAIVVVLFMGMSISAEEIIKDRKILQRESFLNLSRFSYLNSKILFLLLLSAFQTFSFVIVGNLILGIHNMTFAYWMVLFSVAVFSNLLGLNISSAFDSVVTIYILIPLLLIPQILLCGVIVKFDDLQDKTADRDAVPVVGDLMVSRWAFEAMAVEQYKDNLYMADFFEMEKSMGNSRYRSDVITSELIGQLNLVTGWQNQGKPEADIAGKLNIIRNEMKELDDEEVYQKFGYTDKLVPGQFTPDIAKLAKAHLEKLQSIYSSYYKKVRKENDLINSIKEEKGSDYLYEQKMKYHNKSLEDLVLNSNVKEVFRETPNGLMQKIAPIYKKPDFNNGRSHFLSSEKIVFGKSIDTLWFNVGVIWSMCIFFYFALYYDWLRKLLNIGKISFRRKAVNK